MDEANLPYHLQLDAPPLALCTACYRQSWSEDEVGRPCTMPQPDGKRCLGVMESISR